MVIVREAPSVDTAGTLVTIKRTPKAWIPSKILSSNSSISTHSVVPVSVKTKTPVFEKSSLTAPAGKTNYDVAPYTLFNMLVGFQKEPPILIWWLNLYNNILVCLYLLCSYS